jgi:hypothetical protein
VDVVNEHLRTGYDRMVGESYKDYAARCRGRMLAAEQDRDALAAEVRRLRAAGAALRAENERLRAIEQRARFAVVNPLSIDEERATGRAILGEASS